MSKYLPKAERMFQQKLKGQLAPIGYVYDLGGDWNLLGDEGEILIRQWSLKWFDFKRVEELFLQYGYYLELIEDDNELSTSTDG